MVSGLSTVRSRGVAALLLLFLLPAPAPAGDRCFLIVFGAERPSGRAKFAHSIATFVRADEQGTRFESVTISWLPEGRNIHVASLLPERGRNHGLEESLALSLANRMQLSMWGPYEIEPDLYERAVERVGRLESGAIRYKALDSGFSRERVCNCIHAISDLETRGLRLRIGRPSWGKSASYFITLTLAPYMIEPLQIHDWVARRLGLDQYPITVRDLDQNPSSHLLIRTMQNLCHWQVRKNIPE